MLVGAFSLYSVRRKFCRTSNPPSIEITIVGAIWGFPKIRGTLFGGPYNKGYSILGSILGSPYFGKLPYAARVPPSVVAGLFGLVGLACWPHVTGGPGRIT